MFNAKHQLIACQHTLPGYLIALDGGNGSGKSTAIAALADALRSDGHSVVLTREPGGTAIGDKIRSILLDSANESMEPATELLLLAAARAQHVAQVVRPALQAGKTVITDRFAASTIAFQGYARQIPLDQIKLANTLAMGIFGPDVNVILDLDPEIGMQRMKGRGELDRLDAQAMEFHYLARTGYLEQAAADPEHFIVVDASPAQEVVLETLIQQVRDKYRADQEARKEEFLQFEELRSYERSRFG